MKLDEEKARRAAGNQRMGEALRLRPGWKEVEYYLAAREGEHRACADWRPAEYVSKLFNEYCGQFDEHLLGTLEYRGAGFCCGGVKRIEREKFDVVIDLGCGTGLCGEKFQAMAGNLIGSDLAPRMIEKAKQRGFMMTDGGGLEEGAGGSAGMWS